VGNPVPRIGFFAARPIVAGEELSISYGEGGGGGGGGVADGRRQCFCGAVGCRGFLPFDAD
jgi:histone-lysine N-methyltransferase SETMAR